jgi:hypothetical protein
VLSADGKVHAGRLEKTVLLGELALDGLIRDRCVVYCLSAPFDGGWNGEWYARVLGADLCGHAALLSGWPPGELLHVYCMGSV